VTCEFLERARDFDRDGHGRDLACGGLGTETTATLIYHFEPSSRAFSSGPDSKEAVPVSWITSVQTPKKPSVSWITSVLFCNDELEHKGASIPELT
jgi:hypothetical protein